MSLYLDVLQDKMQHQYRWLVTGVAGFIGSHLLNILLEHDQLVVGVDCFVTGRRSNLLDVKRSVGMKWRNFSFLESDIRDMRSCEAAVANVDFVLHQAAVGSIPRSKDNPSLSHENNVDGFFNMISAAKKSSVKRFIYASSSSVYGDLENPVKVESKLGEPQSPYAVSKRVGELYAANFGKVFGMETIGLRYFNVFGPRQNPEGPYAAVIPKWIQNMILKNPLSIYGDGGTSRDFCFVENAVQANILSAFVEDSRAINQIFNIAVGEQTSLLELFQIIRGLISNNIPDREDFSPQYEGFRVGDVKQSRADISKAQALLGYKPAYRVKEGLEKTVDWYLRACRKNRLQPPSPSKSFLQPETT